MTKLEKLLSEWPQGALRTAVAIGKEGYSMGWLDYQRNRGSLLRFAPNIVGRPGDVISVWSALYALNHDVGFSTHIGGLAALQIHGLEQPLRRESVFTLFGTEDRLPNWFTEYGWKEKVIYKACRMLFQKGFDGGIVSHKHQGFFVRVSSPLRAIFEYLHYVPRENSLNDAKRYLSLLGDGAEGDVIRFLLGCRSFKVKRLFLVIAERVGASWFNELNFSNVDIGDSIQYISANGVRNDKYKLYLPKSF